MVTKAPEVAGRIVELPVADNQFVHKGDLLLRHVWHPALFVFSVYIIVLSSMVLIIAR